MRSDRIRVNWIFVKREERCDGVNVSGPGVFFHFIYRRPGMIFKKSCLPVHNLHLRFNRAVTGTGTLPEVP
jgi:hypothetical protein